MRKILSGFLATAMVTSVCATMSFAAVGSDAQATASQILVDLSGVALETKGDDGNGTPIEFDNTAEVTTPKLTINAAGGQIVLTPTSKIYGGMKPSEIAKVFASTPASGIAVSGITKPDGTTALAAADLKLSVQGSTVVISTVATGASTYLEAGVASISPIADAPNDETNADLEFAKGTVKTSDKRGLNAVNETVDVTGATVLELRDIVVCDRNGDPMPLTETNDGVDKDQNSEYGVQSGQTVYFMIQEGNAKFDDDTYWKLKVSKGDNGKYIKSATDTTKIFKNNLYNVNTREQINGTGGVRHRYIKVEMNEIFTDDEYKCSLDLRLTPKTKAVDVFSVDSDTEIKVKDFYFYMKNIVKTADGDWRVGIGGLMLSPLSNDWNEVTYYDEDGDLAFMKFFGDSDVGKFYAKLSTKWEHADYASYFNDQDAYIFSFTGSPKISATSRCDLQIYNPFMDEDGNETIDPASAVIYQVIDGDLIDVTNSFKYEEGDNGEMAYTTRTRFLGTYIICEKAVEEAVDNSADVPADLVPEDTTPSEVTPGNNGGGKAPANTGKYL